MVKDSLGYDENAFISILYDGEIFGQTTLFEYIAS